MLHRLAISRRCGFLPAAQPERDNFRELITDIRMIYVYIHTQCGAPVCDSNKLVYVTPITLWLMVLVTIGTGVSEPTYS